MAANVAVKLVSVLPNSMVGSYVLDLVYALSSLLYTPFIEVAIPCSTSLNLIITKLNANDEKAVWEVLKQTECVIHVVRNIHRFAGGVIPVKIEYFEQMASLLGSILLRWPTTRFLVWNDVKVRNTLSDLSAKTDISTKIIILKLYTSLGIKTCILPVPHLSGCVFSHLPLILKY